jgi:hypothetical protein
LDIKENFFGGEQASEEEIFSLMQDFYKNDATFNIIGKNSVRVALEAGIITEDGVGEISGVPFALVLI